MATNIEYMATPLPPSPKKSLAETMPLTLPSSLSIVARTNRNNNRDEACTPLSTPLSEEASMPLSDEACAPLTEGTEELAEAASLHEEAVSLEYEDVVDINLDIPESNV